MCVKTIAQGNLKKQRHRKQHSVEPCWEQAIVRGCSNAVWQLYFLKIATRSAFRSTLQTSESLKWRASARPRARIMRREQRAFAKIFPVCRAFLITFWAQKVMIERISKNTKEKVKGKNCTKEASTFNANTRAG